MSLPDELLDLAGYILRRQPKHPTQAALRRAASTAYYALFNFLIDQSVERFATDPALQALIRRAFTHTEMRKAARSLASGGSLPTHVANAFAGTLPVELRRIATAFIDLQDARVEGDYNQLIRFDRDEVSAWIEQVRTAFADWQALVSRPADKPAVELFLTGLLLWDRWGKG